jgi:hypothetical protein
MFFYDVKLGSAYVNQQAKRAGQGVYQHLYFSDCVSHLILLWPVRLSDRERAAQALVS